MTAREARRVIESQEFAIRIGVASGLHTLKRAISEEAAVQNLASAVRGDTPEKCRERDALLERVVGLSRAAVDPRYENEHDTALAAYQLVLAQVDRTAGVFAANAAAQAPQCWWAPKVASEILFGAPDERRQQTTTQQTVALGYGFMPHSVLESVLLESFVLESVKLEGITKFALSNLPVEPGPVQSVIIHSYLHPQLEGVEAMAYEIATSRVGADFAPLWWRQAGKDDVLNDRLAVAA